MWGSEGMLGHKPCVGAVSLPTAEVFYWSFPSHRLGAGLAGGMVWERTVFPGARVGTALGKAAAHELWHRWHRSLRVLPVGGFGGNDSASLG